MKKSRIYSIDVLKLFLAYVIAYFHSNMEFRPGPTVTVQIFFIISGFFLGKSYYTRSYGKENPETAWDYTVRHAKNVYPHYFFSLAVYFLYVTARSLAVLIREPSFKQVSDLIFSFYHQLPDVFLLQSSVYFHDSLNYPAWQLSALFIGSYFVYALLVENERLSRRLLFPAAVFMIQCLLITGIDLFTQYGFFYTPILRAISPLCIGVLTYYATTTQYWDRLRAHRKLFDLAAILSLAGVIAYTDYANIFLVTVPLLILNCYDEKSLPNRIFFSPALRFCGDLSYAVFLNHSLISRILWALIVPRMERAGLPFPTWQKAIVYFILLTGYSVFTMQLVNRWKRRHT